MITSIKRKHNSFLKERQASSLSNMLNDKEIEICSQRNTLGVDKNEHVLINHMGYLTNITALHFKLSALKVFKENGFDISPEQCAILFVLANNDGLYQRQISQILLKDRPNTSRLVDILEKKGLVTRELNPKNRRIVKVQITPKGRNQIDTGHEFMFGLSQKAITGIAEEDLETTKKVMAKIRCNLEDQVNIQI